MGNAFFRGAGWGYLLGILTAIAYDTSAAVSLFGGGRQHLTFGHCILWALGGAVVGGIIAVIGARTG